MERREFLQDMSALGAITLLPTSRTEETIPPLSPTSLSPEEGPATGGIGVIAIGDAGGAVLAELSSQLPGLHTAIALDTNPSVLRHLAAYRKIVVASASTGAGQSLSRAHMNALEKALDGIDVVFVIVGTNSVAGTNTSPFVAQVLREKSIPTVVAVVMPFGAEASYRQAVVKQCNQSFQGIAKLVFPLFNSTPTPVVKRRNLLSRLPSQTASSFWHLYRGITAPFITPGFVNLGLEDVIDCFGEGATAIGYGAASGDSCVEEATLRAISHPLLGRRRLFHGSKFLVHIDARDRLLRFRTLNETMNSIRENMDDSRDLYLVCGATPNESQGGDYRVTILVNGIQE